MSELVHRARASDALSSEAEAGRSSAPLHERTRWIYEHLPASFDRVLDVGCHDGSGLAAFVSRGRTGVGVDLDVPALRSDPGKHRLHLLAGSADALPFQEASFDCVVFSEVLEHVPAAVEIRCIDELRRVMVPGGTLLFTTPHRGTFWWLDPLLAKTHLRRIGALFRQERRQLKGHKHYRLEEIETLLEPRFETLVVERRACLLHPLAYWALALGARLGVPAAVNAVWQAFIDADYGHEYGRRAYNLCIVARAR